MLYNWTIDASIKGFLGMTNTLTHGLAIGLIVFCLGVILFSAILFSWGIIIAMMTTGSIMFFLSMLLAVGELVHPLFVFFWLSLCVLGLMLYWITR